MTAPMPPIALPYAVRFDPTSNWADTLAIPAAQQNGKGPTAHALPPGTYTVSLSYSGPESANLQLSQVGGTYSTIATTGIGTSGQFRSSRVVSVVAGVDGALLRVAVSPTLTAATISAKCTGSLSVYPMPTYTPPTT